MSGRPPQKVTLEELLRLKRSERPAANFWPAFEQELRAKQLAAIVEKRPWWHALPRRLVRFYGPVGAAAALALTFALKNHPSPVAAVAPAHEQKVTIVTASSAQPVAAPNIASVAAFKPAAFTPSLTVVAVTPAAANTSTPAQPAVATVPRAVIEADPVRALASAEEVSIATYLSDTTALQPLPSLVGPLAGEALAATVATDTPALTDAHRAKLLALATIQRTETITQPDTGNLTQVHERISRRLSDDLLYASSRRIGLDGDRVTVKF